MSSIMVLGFSGSEQQICFSVDRTGHYQMLREIRRVITERTQGSPVYNKAVSFPPHTELFQGIMLASELEKFEKLIANSEFVKITASAPKWNSLQKGAEDFVAEVPRENGVQHVVMRNSDGEDPFPRSVQEIINWLQQFKTENAEPLDVSKNKWDVCPRNEFLDEFFSKHSFNNLH